MGASRRLGWGDKQIHNTKSHIQGSGRARTVGSRVYYFENDPATEQRLAEHMRNVAMDEQLALTDATMHSETRRQLMRRTVEPVHPFPHHNGAEINLHNGMELVYKYVSKNTLTRGFSPAEGFTFQV
jgi:hypothetical protein